MTPLDRLVYSLQRKGPVVLLESQSADHPESKKTYLAALPSIIIKSTGERITVIQEGEEQVVEQNPWVFLGEFISQNKEWLFGYLGYDLKNYLENLHSTHRDKVDAPELFLMVPELIIDIDSNGEIAGVIKGELPKKQPIPHSVERAQVGELKSSVSKTAYLKKIKEAQQRIKEGDFYEVNLSHQQTAHFEGSAYHLYKEMCGLGPVPFGAYLCFDDIHICSLSPERFLKRVGDTVFSQPIKGTIKRGKNATEDAALRVKLKHSVKDRAENLMVVDLVRNDLSRVAIAGSVKVRDLFQVQTFGTIHQMVSTVSAKAGVQNPVDIIKACYPMGSMTGAPKIRAMQAIEELEDYKRGIYSGAIGYISPDGNFDFNVVIRTAIIKKNKLYYSVGGAITGDSDPQEEWEETLIKAGALTGIPKN